MRTLLTGALRPAPGDVVLAQVMEIGKQKRIELPSGRRSSLVVGDEIIVAYGNRYAPDQFEALVCQDLSWCDLVAAGGVAAREVSRHQRMMQPTQILPVGLIGDAHGRRINLANYALAPAQPLRPITAILVSGTSMNAGKTFSAASAIRGLKQGGHRVAGVKATGTGSGGDLWLMRDIGADVVYDFTDVGFASTYMVSPELLEVTTQRLIAQASRSSCSYVVIELADGLFQQETAALLRSKSLRLASAGVLFAAYDAMGAKTGVQMLRSAGHRVLGLSGQLTRSPLAMREAEAATGVPTFTPDDLQSGALLEIFAGATPPRSQSEDVLPADPTPPAFEQASSM